MRRLALLSVMVVLSTVILSSSIVAKDYTANGFHVDKWRFGSSNKGYKERSTRPSDTKSSLPSPSSVKSVTTRGHTTPFPRHTPRDRKRP